MNKFKCNKAINGPRIGVMIIFFLLLSVPSHAHVVVEELDEISTADAAIRYTELGFKHILPLGMDHILFVLSLFLLSPKLKPLLLQSATFTLAHSITLCLAAYGLLVPPSNIVEPLIALSIVYVALENVLHSKLKLSRLGVVFLFGLVHGAGFAGALAEMGLPKNAFLTSLVMFNVGVELGQVAVILIAYFLLARWFSDKPYYRKRIVVPLSLLIAGIASFWTVQRIFFN